MLESVIDYILRIITALFLYQFMNVPAGGGAGGGKLLGILQQRVVELVVAALGELAAVSGLGDLLKSGFHVHKSCSPFNTEQLDTFPGTVYPALSGQSTVKITKLSLLRAFFPPAPAFWPQAPGCTAGWTGAGGGPACPPPVRGASATASSRPGWTAR